MSREALKKAVRELFAERLAAAPEMSRLIGDTKYALNYGHDGLSDDSPYRGFVPATKEIREWFDEQFPGDLFYDQVTGCLDVGTPDEDCFDEQVIVEPRYVLQICLGELAEYI